MVPGVLSEAASLKSCVASQPGSVASVCRGLEGWGQGSPALSPHLTGIPNGYSKYFSQKENNLKGNNGFLKFTFTLQLK